MPNEKVLIVDDEKLIRWSVRRQLEEWGYTAIEAESGTGGTGADSRGSRRT
jgi:CheY-like chemotaxis protein